MKTEWWKKFYDQHLAHMLLHPAAGDDSSKTCDFLINALQLKEGDRIFDQCCGTGRLALELAQRGFDLTGIDLAEGYIEEAKKAQVIRTHFEVADAFLYKTAKPCDAVINWWTSFGYSREDEQNCQMLTRAFESLKPGGYLAMDYMNVPNLYRHFRALVTTEREGDSGKTTLHRHSEIDLFNGQLLKKWHYILPNGESVEHETSTQLYTPPQLVEFFKRYGFTEIRLIGDIDGSDLTLESPRCIIIGRKPLA